jgi:hypothetical protein
VKLLLLSQREKPPYQPHFMKLLRLQRQKPPYLPYLVKQLRLFLPCMEELLPILVVIE